MNPHRLLLPLILLVVPVVGPMAPPPPSQDVETSSSSAGASGSAESADPSAAAEALARELLQKSRTKPATPARRDRPTPGHISLPEVPESYDRSPPLAAAISITVTVDGQAHTVSQIFTRTARQAHVEFASSRQEWYFQRNPVDPARVNAWLVDHRERVVLAYYLSDRIQDNIAASWWDVATLGVRRETLEALAPTEEVETIAGIRFTRYVSDAPPSTEDQVRELWWNEEHLLPLRIVRGTDEAEVRIELTELVLEARGDVLAHPAKRFPDYLAQDVVDWREEHHGDEDHAGHGH